MLVCGTAPCVINGLKRPGRGAYYYLAQTVPRARRSGVTGSIHIYIYTYGLHRNNFYHTLGVKQYKLYTEAHKFSKNLVAT